MAKIRKEKECLEIPCPRGGMGREQQNSSIPGWEHRVLQWYPAHLERFSLGAETSHTGRKTSFCVGKNTGVGCHAPLQGIFLLQELNPCLLCLLHCLTCWTTHRGSQYMYLIHSLSLPNAWLLLCCFSHRAKPRQLVWERGRRPRKKSKAGLHWGDAERDPGLPGHRDAPHGRLCAQLRLAFMST